MDHSCYRIGIDCRFWGIKHAGLGRYTRELVLEMVKQKPREFEFTLFFNKGDWREDNVLLKDCTIVEVTIPHYSLKEQFIFGSKIDSQKLDLMHFPHFNVPVTIRTSFVVTIHDLIKHFFKGSPVTTRNLIVYWLKYGGYRLTIRSAIRNAVKIITPSCFAKDQVSVHYPGSERKITVVYEGVSQEYIKSTNTKNMQKYLVNKYNVSTPYFVYTGSAYPSKNISTLLDACTELLKKGIEVRLLIACARNTFWDKLRNDVVEKQLTRVVSLPGRVSDEDLKLLYSQAQAFVMPSLMEGFGLPALEAMSVGCPVIASNTGSLPEVYGDAALYFNPHSVSELADQMERVITMPERERLNVIKKVKQQASSYSWEKAAQETLSVYQESLNVLYPLSSVTI